MNEQRRAPYLDSHAHVQASQFHGDAAGVIARAAAAGVGTVVCASDDEASSRDAVHLAARFDSVWATVGVHPHESKAIDAGTWHRLAELARSDLVVAIGEIGLDYYRDLSPRPVQREVFAQQLGLASSLGLPVVIHSRDAADDTYAMLRSWRSSHPHDGSPPGVLHCFSYDAAWAGRFLELEFVISIPGTVTYPKAEQMRAVAVSVPEASLLVETDSPYLSPQPWRGKRNEPSYLPQTVSAIASLRGVDALYLAVTTAANARRLFRLDQRAHVPAASRSAP